MNIAYGINLTSKLLRGKLNRELEKEGLTAAQFAVIKDIEIHSKLNKELIGVTAVEIAERLDMDKPTVSGIINRLISKGYVEKIAHPKDKRAFLLRLTNVCIEALPAFEEINNKIILTSLEGIKEEELKVFNKVIDRIINNLK